MHDLAALRRVLSAIEDIVFPPSCGGCGRRGSWLCRSCARTLRPLPAPLCLRCGRPLADEVAWCDICAAWPSVIGQMRGAYTFDGALRESIHRFKYQGEHARAASLAALLLEPAQAMQARWDLISPVSLHPRRRRQRGFDQARLLGQRLGRELTIPLTDGLRRVRETRPQVGLGFSERQENVRDAFAWTAEPLDGESLLLIDDVVTTGATMAAAASALQAAGAGRVDGLALARAI